jgi:hypothetical protein
MRIFAFIALLTFASPALGQEDPDTAITIEERLQLAQVAFRGGEFNQIRPMLEAVLVPTSKIEDSDLRIEARQLLAVGYFYDAQQVTSPEERRAFLQKASDQFLELLRERPDFTLDALLFPASVVELFDQVQIDNAAELDALRAKQSPNENSEGVETFYVERRVEQRNFALTFLPFGVGQLQNGEVAKGTFFAVTQVLTLGINISSYLMIESLRGEDGYYDPGVDRRSGDYASALTWKNVMYGTGFAFLGLWAASVVDAIIQFEEFDVTIRALDAPPPELLPREQSGLREDAPIGWSLEFSF